MHSTRRHLLSLIIGLSAASALFAQTKPNFTGTWKVNIAKSDFGSFPAPKSSVMKIDHQDPKFVLNNHAETDMGDQDIDLKLTTDGTEATNQVGQMEVKTKAHWDGNVLVMDSKLETDGGEVTISDKWKFSEDGKQFSIERHWSGPQGDMDQVMVHEKQS